MSRTSPHPVRRASTLALTLFLTWGTPAQAAGGADQGTVVAAAAKKVSPQVTYQRQAQRTTNRVRARHDLATLKGNPCLRRWARKHANRLADAGAGLWHQDVQRVGRACKLRVGENIALGYPHGRAVVNQGWMKSKGHRENILNPRFTHSVVVARQDQAGRWYAVQLFGRR